MKRVLILIGLAFLMFQFACQQKNSGKGGELESLDWHLTEYTLKKQKHIPLGRQGISLRLEAGQLNGNGSCNGYFGSYSVQGTKLDISAIGATEMACPVVMEQEQNYFDLLEGSETFTREGSRLTIYSKNGNLVFQSTP